MQSYSTFADEIEGYVLEVLNTQLKDLDNQVLSSYLNGRASLELRNLVPLDDRKKNGIFFTNSGLAADAISKNIVLNFSTIGSYLDPAVGAGDLLLEITKQIPAFEDLNVTLRVWGEKLFGADLYLDFIRVTKARLILAAISRGAKINKIHHYTNLTDFFPNIIQCDFLNLGENFFNTSNIIINPPYSMTRVTSDTLWARGKVSNAAIFLEKCIKKSQNGTIITAILPDVLRTGERYKEWRKYVNSNTEIKSIRIYGKFDQWTDIDVFILHLKVNKNRTFESNNTSWVENSNGATVKDFFNVSVGSVVPYRDPEVGETYPYITPKSVPPWASVQNISSTRKYKGTVFTPPFVVVRRTSSPDDMYRAVGSIIELENKIAVENHLIILRPVDGSINTCKRLLKLLKSARTNEWLNRRIRCRHLTVASLKELPWEEIEG